MFILTLGTALPGMRAEAIEYLSFACTTCCYRRAGVRPNPGLQIGTCATAPTSQPRRGEDAAVLSIVDVRPGGPILEMRNDRAPRTAQLHRLGIPPSVANTRQNGQYFWRSSLETHHTLPPGTGLANGTPQNYHNTTEYHTTGGGLPTSARNGGGGLPISARDMFTMKERRREVEFEAGYYMIGMHRD